MTEGEQMAFEISQTLANELIKIDKEFVKKNIQFPLQGDCISCDLLSLNKQHEFVLTISRKGIIDLTKCNLQKRYDTTPTVLVRIDLDGSRTHTNPPPDNRTFREPHIHLYREGFGDLFAEPLFTLFPELEGTDLNPVDVFIKLCE